MMNKKLLPKALGLAVLVLSAVPLMADQTYNFQTVNFPGDTFTQLLGINNSSTIAGYHGATVNVGFTLTLPSNFVLENFPNATSTQVIGINNSGMTDGFFVDTNGTTHGFINTGGTFTTVDAPNTAFNQLLGINDKGVAAGYSSTDPTGATLQMAYVDDNGTFNYLTKFLPSWVGNNQATGINDKGEVSGFYLTNGGADSFGFLFNGGTLTSLEFPGSTFTQTLGVNDAGQAVGFYLDAGGATHGFLYANGTYQSIDDPSGASTTTINGTNDKGQIVGFYTTDMGQVTNGFVATPTPEPATMLLLGTGLLGLAMMLRRKLHSNVA